MDQIELSYASVAEYLTNIYDLINADWFNGELKTPVITIQSSPKTYGHVVLGDMWHIENEGYMELNISAGTLDRSIYNIVATIVHECVHIYCYMNNIKDTSNGNAYHNKNFKLQAESHGLHIQKHNTYGYTITSPSPTLIDWVDKHGFMDIRMARNDSGCGSDNDNTSGLNGGNDLDNQGDDFGQRKRKSHIKKYRCMQCGVSVRASKTVNIGCLDCGLKMITDEE